MVCYCLYNQFFNYSNFKIIDKNKIKTFIEINQRITMEFMEEVVSKINESTSDEIFLYIDSNGGELLSGQYLIYEIMNIDKNISCIAKNAKSIAFDIFAMCDTRYVLHNSLLFQHEATYSFTGTSDEVSEYYSKFILYSFLDSIINLQISMMMNISYDVYMNNLKKGFEIKSGKEIIKKGLADELITFNEY